jgi:hemimethylated DNA binding protein
MLNVTYEFQPGAIVRHSHLRQDGVVAACFPICFESDQWVQDKLGSARDVRLRHPWYIILVETGRDAADFVRYGSQLTHEKSPPSVMGISFNRYLPMFFRGFDKHTGMYLPRTPLVSPESATQSSEELKPAVLNVDGERAPACRRTRPKRKFKSPKKRQARVVPKRRASH